MTGFLLGIDIGTSAVKAGVFEPDGRLLGVGRQAYETDTPRPGWAECDPERWWHGVIGATAEACRAAEIDAAEIRAIGVGVLFPAVMPLDADGHALHPALLYCDQRSLGQVAAIRERIAIEAYEAVIGNVLVPGTCAVSSLAWLRDEQPEAWRAATCIGWINTFINKRLTGEFATDPSMAALSGLVDIRNPWQWSDALCGQLDIDLSRLPRIVGSADVVGVVTPTAAKQTGLRAGTPVVSGAGDVPVSAVGTGAESAGSVAYTVGSTDCVAVPMTRPTNDRRWINCAYIPHDVWLGIGTITSSGVSIEWFTREVLGQTGGDAVTHMTELAALAAPGCQGLLYLPYLQGERTPIWDPIARGAFLGLTTRTTKADLARAIFEGTAFALRHVIECLEDVVEEPVGRIRAVGGGARNMLWNQIKADMLQREIDVLDFQETGTLGAALLAGLGAGVYGSFAEAVAVARRVGDTQTVAPDPAKAALYDELFALYVQGYPATRDIARGLAECRTAAPGSAVRHSA